MAGAPVTFTDAGHIQTVNTDVNGNATSTFKLNIFQEVPKAHSVSAWFQRQRRPVVEQH